jgi:UDP-2-acetamido-3-amino-2,3-dideoxy-glucuronate N-acetyltransferase
LVREGNAVSKVSRIELVTVADSRGLLTAAQYPENLPFVPMRVFTVTNSPSGTYRGGHAHRKCHQVLIATAGTVVVEFDDDDGTASVTLSDASQCLHIPPLVWAKQKYATEGASLIVLASHTYDADDYVDDRETARGLRESSKPPR